MYTSSILGQGPQKLSNSPKWLKPPPYLLSSAEEKHVGEGEESVMGSYQDKHSDKG